MRIIEAVASFKEIGAENAILLEDGDTLDRLWAILVEIKELMRVERVTFKKGKNDPTYYVAIAHVQDDSIQRGVNTTDYHLRLGVRRILRNLRE